LGTAIARLSGQQNILEVGCYTIERSMKRERRTDGEGYFDSKVYRFGKASAATHTTEVTTSIEATAELGLRVQIFAPSLGSVWTSAPWTCGSASLWGPENPRLLNERPQNTRQHKKNRIPIKTNTGRRVGMKNRST